MNIPQCSILFPSVARPASAPSPMRQSTPVTASLLTSLLFLVLMLPTSLRAQFDYTTNNGAITITGYHGSDGVVMIPGTIADLPVASIGDWAFYSAGITNVLVPDTVTNIGDGAFFDCQSLTNITLGSSVMSIGDWAFGFSPSLVSVCCRGSAPGLGGDNVFNGNLATVYYLSGGSGWESTFGGRPTVLWDLLVPFSYTTNNGTITITGCTAYDGEATIPSSINFLPVTRIGDSAFYQSRLNSVLVPDGVTSIGISAFDYCFSLTNVTLPSSVVSIERNAFDSCTSLINITIPSVASLGDFAFRGCSLETVTLPNTLTNLGTAAFAGCPRLAAINVDAGNVFYSSASGVLFDKSQTRLIQYPGGLIGSYAIPNNMTCLGDWAFAGCSLTSVTIPNSITNIPYEAFRGATRLAEVNIPSSVISIGSSAFASCTSLGSITIPDSVTRIEDGTFYFCTNLSSITIPNTVTRIGYATFNRCFSLTNLTIPNSVINIGDDAFAECTGLAGITLPNSLTNIADGVLGYCLRLASVTIPDSVTRIGNSAFFHCASLTNVTIPNSVTDVEANAFAECYSLVNITIPDSITSIRRNTFFYCLSLTNITIPGSVTNIERSAFGSCYNLRGIYFQGNAPLSTGVEPFPGNGTVYYLPGTTGWGSTLGGLPTALWLPAIQTADGRLGVQTNQFGFNIQWASDQTVVVEACTNLFSPAWQPVQTNTLTTGSAYFSDPQWTNYPGRFYRVRQL